MTGVELITAERARQVDAEGWSAGHDDLHSCGELVNAAVALINLDEDFWPWGLDTWKPKSRVSDLVRAGALIAAEIDRLQRRGPVVKSTIHTSEYHERHLHTEEMFKQVVGKLPILVGIHRLLGDIDGEEQIQDLYCRCLAALESKGGNHD